MNESVRMQIANAEAMAASIKRRMTREDTLRDFAEMLDYSHNHYDSMRDLVLRSVRLPQSVSNPPFVHKETH